MTPDPTSEPLRVGDPVTVMTGHGTPSKLYVGGFYDVPPLQFWTTLAPAPQASFSGAVLLGEEGIRWCRGHGAVDDLLAAYALTRQRL